LSIVYTRDKFLLRNKALFAKYRALMWMWRMYLEEGSYGGEC
jgi:hypothetical protein